MDSQMLNQITSNTLDAMATCLSPNANNISRKSAETFLSTLKSNQGIEVGFHILNNASLTQNNTDFQVLACSILGDSIKQQYNGLSIDQRIALRHQLFGLFSTNSNNQGNINSNLLFNSKICRVKIAVISAYVAERQYPELWPSFISDCVGLWQSLSSLESQIIIIMIFATILEDCIDSDFNNTMTSVQRREILSGIKANSITLLTISIQYYNYLLSQYESINWENADAGQVQATLLEDALNQLLKMLCPLVNHLKPLSITNISTETSASVDNSKVIEELNEMIISLTTRSTLKVSLIKSAIELLHSIITSEKLDLTSIFLIMKHLVSSNLAQSQLHTSNGKNIFTLAFADNKSTRIFYQNMYTLSVFKLIGTNVREIYCDSGRNKSLVVENGAMLFQYFQMMVQCIQLNVTFEPLSYRLSADLINEWIKIFKEYPTLNSLANNQAMSPKQHQSSSEQYKPIPWIEELVPLLIEFYQEKSVVVPWEDGVQSINPKLYELLEVEFDEPAEYKEFHGTFKSQIRGLLQILSQKFPIKALEGLSQLTAKLFNDNLRVNSPEVWNSFPSLLEGILNEAYKDMFPHIHGKENIASLAGFKEKSSFQSGLTTQHVQAVSIGLSILQSLTSMHASNHSPSLLLAMVKCISSCGTILSTHHQLGDAISDLLQGFNSTTYLLQIFQLLFQYYKLNKVYIDDKIRAEDLFTFIGTIGTVISELCESCHCIILASTTPQQSISHVQPFPIQEFISCLCDILSLANVQAKTVTGNSISVPVPIYAKTRLRDCLVVLSDRISPASGHSQEKVQLLTIALGSVISSWNSSLVPNLQETPSSIFSSTENFVLACQRGSQEPLMHDLLQESSGILRYLISSAKRVSIPVIPESILYSSNSQPLLISQIRENYPYIDVWVASMPILFQVSYILHESWSPIFRRSLTLKDRQTGSFLSRMYIPSILEACEALGSTTSHSIIPKEAEHAYKALWYGRYMAKTFRQLTYLLVEKAIYHHIFWLEDLTFKVSIGSHTLSNMDDYIRTMISVWLPSMENDHVILFLKHVFDLYVTSAVFRKYSQLEELISAVISHMNDRIRLAYQQLDSNQQSAYESWVMSGDIDSFMYHTYHNNNIPKGYTYNDINGTGSILSHDNIELSTSMLTSSLVKQYADTLLTITGCKGILSRSQALAVPAYSSNIPDDLRDLSMKDLSDDTNSFRRNTLRNFLHNSNPNLLTNILASLSMLLRLPVLDTVKKAMLVISEVYLERCYQITESSNSIISPCDQHLITFITQAVFSVGSYILVRNSPWSVGLEWEMISLLTQIYWTMTLGQKSDDSATTLPANQTSRTIGNTISDQPRQILLSLPYVSTPMVEELERNLLQCVLKKARRDILRDFFVSIIQAHKASGDQNSFADRIGINDSQQLNSDSILLTKSNSMKDNSDISDRMDDTSGKSSILRIPSVVELGDCDLTKIFN